MASTEIARPRRPIRIGNAAGAIGDGIDQVYRLAKSGAVDAITADYLAEFNIAWKAIELQSAPGLGFEPNFLEQLAWEDGDASRLLASNRIKVVHDGGALNPVGLATKVDSYFKSLGLTDVRVAAVTGDDITQGVANGDFGEIRHLDRQGVVLDQSQGEILAANVYTGQAGIVRALEEGADVVICGRCCDASPVMGLAYWWHGWQPTDYDQMAGSLMAGHLIECGAYVTGGNYCGAEEIEQLHHVGYPIAEIANDGTSIITKPPGTNGAVTIDTCKGQLLYEIQGPIYLNPDVVADIEEARLQEVDKDRVLLTGIRGTAPPPTAKLAVCLRGGWQAELSGFAAGCDTDFKFQLMKDQVMRQINPADFTTFSMEKYGFSKVNPVSQNECTVHFRLFAQSLKKEAITQFRRAIFYNGMQGYCGLHLSMDWRTMEPKPYVKYFPALTSQSNVRLTVHFIGEDANILHVEPNMSSTYATSIPQQRNYEPSDTYNDAFTICRRSLGSLVFARSGDKGGNANVGFWVRDARAWPWLRSFLSSPRLKQLFGRDWNDKYSIERCEFPRLWAVHFVIKGMLQEGVSSSSILDGFAKSLGEFLRARYVEMPMHLGDLEEERRKKARAIQFST
ncbi:hypothetical protein F4819DRAFT_472793 [Hypoxylon fuscum]|nr:hypothetical protein F4819DRAFT_472793 [Hypoxylon fuscum]